MEKQLFSFLIFCISFAIWPQQLMSQENIDSTTYHYKNILNPQKSTDLPNAIIYYTALKENHLKSKNIYKVIEDLRMIAIAQFEIGNSFESESSMVEALKLIDNSSSSDTLIETRKGLYNQLGKIYRTSFRHSEAIEAYNKALQFSNTQSDSIVLLNNKGNIYRDMALYENALEQFELALAKSGIRNNPRSYAMILDNKGAAQAKLNNPEALANFQEALLIKEQENDLIGKYPIYRNLAFYYFDKNDKVKAFENANLAYNVAIITKNSKTIKDALSIFTRMNPDPKVVRYGILSDSLAKEKQLAENKNAFMKYNVEKERKNTLAAQLKQEKQKTWNIIIVVISLVTLVLGILFYFTLKSRHKQEKIGQIHTTEKRISKKVHDEVANDVYRLMAKLQSKPAEKEDILDDLESIYNKTRDISKENSAVDVENFQEVLSDLLLSYENETLSIIRRNEATIDWNSVSDINKTNLYRVLQELMTNMAKHSKATAVVLNLDQQGKSIIIKYADNGIGSELKSKNGLQNAESRIEAINGTITFDSKPNKGFRATIII